MSTVETESKELVTAEVVDDKDLEPIVDPSRLSDISEKEIADKDQRFVLMRAEMKHAIGELLAAHDCMYLSGRVDPMIDKILASAQKNEITIRQAVEQVIRGVYVAMDLPVEPEAIRPTLEVIHEFAGEMTDSETREEKLVLAKAPGDDNDAVERYGDQLAERYTSIIELGIQSPREALREAAFAVLHLTMSDAEVDDAMAQLAREPEREVPNYSFASDGWVGKKIMEGLRRLKKWWKGEKKTESSEETN